MIPPFLLEKEIPNPIETHKGTRLLFIDKTINRVATFVLSTFLLWTSSRIDGLLQQIDGRVKVGFLLIFIVLISISTSLNIQLLFASVLFLLSLCSRLHLIHLYKKILLIGFIFGFIIFIPSSLNIFTKGENIFTIVQFSQPHKFWIYSIPANIYVTSEGISLVLRLTMKVINSVTLVLIIISTTTFERLIKSLSFFKVPAIFLLTLSLSYRFIFVLSSTVIETYQALKMRWWKRGSVNEAETIVAGRIVYLFRKSWNRYELTYQSMVARGFNGKVSTYYFNKLKLADYIFMVVFGFLFFILAIIQHIYG